MEFETLKLEAQRVDYAGDDGSSSEDELKEVAEELEVLKADTVYHDFVSDVVFDRKILDDAESVDPDFVVKLPRSGEPSSVDGKIDLKDLIDEDSSSGEDSVYEEATEDVEVKIPPTSLKEAAARYPPFWRFNDKLHREANLDYKSDDDPDYKVPAKCGKCSSSDGQVDDGALKNGDDKAGCEDCYSEIIIDSDDTGSTTTTSSHAEDDDVANLVEMVEELALPSNDVELEDAEEDEDNGDLVRSIVEHDDTDYKSDEDPDYVAPIDVDNGISDDGSSADDESSDHEEMMQE